MPLLLWSCLAVVGYVYFGYPLLLRLGVLGQRVTLVHAKNQPSLSVIVAAHNEESTIEAKLKCLLASDYPRERLQILIGNDGSSDATEDILRKYWASGIHVVCFPLQRGKSAIQNGLAAGASGDILVFTDADSLFRPSTLRQLADNFADPRVGLVTGRASYTNTNETEVARNEGLYLRYDTWLRKRESECGILAVASGSLFAMRRSLWQPLDPGVGDDFAFPLHVARAGMRNILDPCVVAATRLSQDRPRAMLRMKVRIISKDLRALLQNIDLLNPARYGSLSVGLISHKLLRWLVPYFLLILAVSNVFLLDGSFFRVSLALQTAFYALALLGLVRRNRPAPSLWSIPMSFCLVNLAALFGTLRCFAGRTSGMWTPERNGGAPVPAVIHGAAAARGPR